MRCDDIFATWLNVFLKQWGIPATFHYSSNNNGSDDINNNSFVFWVSLFIFAIFWFYLFIPENIFPLFKGEVAVKFDRFNLGFWSWRWGDQLVMVSEVVGFIS